MGPKHFILPSGIVSTAYPSVKATCAAIGTSFDAWQEQLNRAILARDKYGMWAADIVVMSICRQAGKTFDIGELVFADSIKNPGRTTVWTAHRFKVARETFNELKQRAESPLLAAHLDAELITTGAGNEMIPFYNGSRIVFAARERGSIRGFSKVDRLILDEAQILTEAGMADLAPTMNQAQDPQIIMMGTPPKPPDPGEVFTRIRKDAIDGTSEDVLYVEYGADEGAPVDPGHPEFWAQVEKANPSFPHRTKRRAILRLRKLLTDDDNFRREALGIWDSDRKKRRMETFQPEGAWEAAARDERPDDVVVTGLALAVSIDLRSAAIAASGLDGDENVWVKVLVHGPGTGWVFDELPKLQDGIELPIVVDRKGPAASLIPLLERDGVELKTVGFPEALDAFDHMTKRVANGSLRYVSTPELLEAEQGAATRPAQNGERRLWARAKSENDISPLEAATFAVWAALNPQDLVPESAYESRGVITI